MSGRRGTEVRRRQHQLLVRFDRHELGTLHALAERSDETPAAVVRRLIRERNRCMSDPDECRHGMTPEFCADCRGLSLDAPQDWTIVRHLEAKFDGVCAKDGRRILVGMIIGVTDERDYLCEGCVKDLDQ